MYWKTKSKRISIILKLDQSGPDVLISYTINASKALINTCILQKPSQVGWETVKFIILQITHGCYVYLKD